MQSYITPKNTFKACTAAGLGLLMSHFLITGDIMGFFIMLFLLCMFALRSRLPKLWATSIVDVAATLIFFPYAFILAGFTAMYHRLYFAILGVLYVAIAVDVQVGGMALLACALGFTLKLWELETEKRLATRDQKQGQYYRLEALQESIMESTSQIERMTAITERARISREIHDNAGHEIIAAFMSMQTIRGLFEGTDPDILELYDDALTRLDSGVKKMRDAVHNMAPVTALGVEVFKEICEKYPQPIAFKSYGNTATVPVHVWNTLESCLNEALTNIGKHAKPTAIKVELDVTKNLVRLSVENDGAIWERKGTGAGLRNLNYRLTAIGGTFTAAGAGGVFKAVCTVPLEENENAK